MRSFAKRTLTALIYGAIMVAGMIIHPLVFCVVFMVLTLVTLLEFYTLSEMAGAFPWRTGSAVIAALFFGLFFGIVSGYLPANLAGVLPVLPFLLMIAELYRKKETPFLNVALTLAGFIYVVIPMSLTSLLIFSRNGDELLFNPHILLGVTITLWLFDSGAYMVGTKWGKHRLFERISPKKSWEGVIGGGVAAILSAILNSWLFPSLELLHWLVLSIIVIFFATWGDLVESLLKRCLKIKDSGNIMPGHGGFLDRFDSFLMIIPAVVAWLWINKLL